MPQLKVEKRALEMLKAFEDAGKPVGSVMIEGRKIQLVFTKTSEGDDFDQIDMRYDQT